MLSRRELMTAGMTGTLYYGMPSTAAADGAPVTIDAQSDRDGQREIARAISEAGSSVTSLLSTNSTAHGFVGKIRELMNTFLRGNGKFPDFMDIGIAVFWDLYDWHIKNEQQLIVTRGTDGRYWMQFAFTTLLLRHEVEPSHIGVPFDKV
jgi:hypothetical protein